jgi:hypothetical protein
MAQSRPQYAYNPDLPTRKWHQKWINPIISLQNAPPTSHGTPAPTKEDGEVGHAGFRVRAWIPVDEDEDVPEEQLQQEVDCWSKPGAPIRPDLRAAQFAAVSTVIEKVNDDVMQIDPPNETTGIMNGDAIPPVISLSSPNEPSVLPEATASLPIVSPKPPTSPQQIDTEMTEVHASPVRLSAVPGSSPSSHRTSTPMQANSPSPLSRPPLQHTDTPKSGASPEPAMMEDILGEPRPSPPSDPLLQAKEIAFGLAIETPTEQAEHTNDAGSLSGVGGGIAGEGIVGGGIEDLGDTKELAEQGIQDESTMEEEQILQESKTDLNTEIVKDDTQ